MVGLARALGVGETGVAESRAAIEADRPTVGTTAAALGDTMDVGATVADGWLALVGYIVG